MAVNKRSIITEYDQLQINQLEAEKSEDDDELEKLISDVELLAKLKSEK